MAKGKILAVFVGSVAALGLALGAGTAEAGSKYQTTLVPDEAGTMPGFSGKGSSVKLDGKLRLKGKIKKVVDGAGERISTDPLDPGDDYSLEVDVAVPATGSADTIEVPFDLRNGNGKFKVDLSAEPVFAGSAIGDGVAVNAVRVKNGVGGAVIGRGGFAREQ